MRVKGRENNLIVARKKKKRLGKNKIPCIRSVGRQWKKKKKKCSKKKGGRRGTEKKGGQKGGGKKRVVFLEPSRRKDINACGKRKRRSGKKKGLALKRGGTSIPGGKPIKTDVGGKTLGGGVFFVGFFCVVGVSRSRGGSETIS